MYSYKISSSFILSCDYGYFYLWKFRSTGFISKLSLCGVPICKFNWKKSPCSGKDDRNSMTDEWQEWCSLIVVGSWVSKWDVWKKRILAFHFPLGSVLMKWFANLTSGPFWTEQEGNWKRKTVWWKGLGRRERAVCSNQPPNPSGVARMWGFVGLLDTWKKVSLSFPVGTPPKKVAVCVNGSTNRGWSCGR